MPIPSWFEIAAVVQTRGPDATSHDEAEEAICVALGPEFFRTLTDVVVRTAPGWQLALHVMSVIHPKWVVMEALERLANPEVHLDALVSWCMLLREAAAGRDLDALVAAFRSAVPGRAHLIGGVIVHLTHGWFDDATLQEIESLLRSSADPEVVSLVRRTYDDEELA